MVRSALPAVCLALLVVTTGCSALFPGPEDRPDRTTREPFGVPDTTTTTTAATDRRPTPVASAAFRETVSNHSRTLRTADRFVVREQILLQTGERGSYTAAPINQTFAADFGADRYWFGIATAPESGVYDEGRVYQNDSSVCRRRFGDDGARVYRCDGDPPEPTPRTWARSWLRTAPNETTFFPFERNGTATADGEELARYTATEPGPFGCVPGVGVDPDGLQNVTVFQATALVDDQGVVRRFECVLGGHLQNGAPYTERRRWAVTEIGTATLEPPENAVNATGSRDD